MNDQSLLYQGGPIMWVLLFVSLFGFVVFVERTLFLHKGQIRTEEFLSGIKNLVEKGRRMEALTLCEDIPGPVPGVVKAILIEQTTEESRLRAAATSAAIVELPILERRIGALAAIARAGPLLGLVGTLLGLMQSFGIFSGPGLPANPHFGELLGGIGSALSTTIVGLMVGIMAHFAYHFLAGRVRALVHDLEYTAHELITLLTKSPLSDAKEKSTT